MPPGLFFFLKVALAIWGLPWFSTNFGIICSNSVKKITDILIGIGLNLQIALSRQDGNFDDILPIHCHRPSFHVFISCLLSSFTSVSQFLEYRSFPALVKFIHGYFILFDVVFNGIIFFAFSFTQSIISVQKAADLCMLTLQPATLLNSIISLNCVCVLSGFSIYSIVLPASESDTAQQLNNNTCKQGEFHFFPPNLDAFYLFCLIAVAKTSSTMINRNGESGHPCY